MIDSATSLENSDISYLSSRIGQTQLKKTHKLSRTEAALKVLEKSSGARNILSLAAKVLDTTGHFRPSTLAVTSTIFPVFQHGFKAMEAISFFETIGWWIKCLILKEPETLEEAASKPFTANKFVSLGSGTTRTLIWLESIGTPIGLIQRTALIGRVTVSSIKFASSFLAITGLTLSIIHDLTTLKETRCALKLKANLSDNERNYYVIKEKTALISLITDVFALTLSIASLLLLTSGMGTVFIMGFHIAMPVVGLFSVYYKIRHPTPDKPKAVGSNEIAVAR